MHNKKIIDAVAEICSACEKGGVVCLYKMREEHCKKLRCEMKRKMYILDLNRGWVKLVTDFENVWRTKYYILTKSEEKP